MEQSYTRHESQVLKPLLAGPRRRCGLEEPHRVGVMYVDFRFSGMKDPKLGSNKSRCMDQCLDRGSFDKRLKKFIGEIRVTEQSFDIRELYGEYSHGVFDELNFGSYFQLTAVDNTFYVAWQETVEPYGSYPARYMDSMCLRPTINSLSTIALVLGACLRPYRFARGTCLTSARADLIDCVTHR